MCHVSRVMAVSSMRLADVDADAACCMLHAACCMLCHTCTSGVWARAGAGMCIVVRSMADTRANATHHITDSSRFHGFTVACKIKIAIAYSMLMLVIVLVRFHVAA
jgi:hypothetical protein